MSNIKLTKTEQSILSEIQSGILVGHYNYHWRSGDRIKHGDELTQRQVKAVESLIAKGLVVMQNGICTIPTIQDGASAMQVGGEVLEVTADYAPATAEQVAPAATPEPAPAPVYTHTITAPDGRVIRVNDITPDIIADFREDAWWVEGEAARADNSKLAGQIWRLAYGQDYRTNAVLFDGLDDVLNLSRADQSSRFSRPVYREDRPVRHGMEILFDDMWERFYNDIMGEGWAAIKPILSMMRIDTVGFVMLNVPAVMIGKWGWEINTTQITHLPTGKIVMHLPNNRENEAGRGEIAIVAMLMLEDAIGDLDTEDECFEYGRKVTVNQLERLYRMDRLPRVAYPARAVGALKAKITRTTKAPKN